MITEGGEEHTQSTQAATQTQPASQPAFNPIDEHLWGCLIPCSNTLRRIDFNKNKKLYTVGRNPTDNNIVLPAKKISNHHCRISWDEKETHSAAIVVEDLSSNGTFINGNLIGRGLRHIIYDGNEISFGSSSMQPAKNPAEDFRFVFRHMAGGIPTSGMNAFYQLHTELGRGCFATVWKAIHRPTGAWYAIKTMQRKQLRQNSVLNAGDDAKYDREISILESLDHPNICKMKEVFFEEYTINLVLEYVTGGDLLDYIVTRQRLSEQISKHFAYQLCDALAYIHSKGIAHRDLKPENVLLTDSPLPNVKVADFGLAKVANTYSDLRTMCGTPAYLAPEVVLQENENGYDLVVDSWSMGVIVFCMLTGQSAFPDDNEGHLRDRVMRREVDWITFRECCSSELAERFIRRLVERDPARRMTAAAALEHPWLELERIVARHQHRERTASPKPVIADDASMHTVTANDDDNDKAQDEPMEEETFEVTGSQFGDIPGAYPHSQPLQRRALILSQQEEALPKEPIGEPIPGVDVLAAVPEEDSDGASEATVPFAPPRGARYTAVRQHEVGDEGAAERLKRAKVDRKKVEASASMSPRGVRRSARLHASPAKTSRR
ncbi:Pkinase-domain-containing protein [Laetiporus sulphureus 93-53]|uniref:Pkinase-domain-containing protein n=1 Tax=Laetiporus sulphureus 93-53 TaxID=1314785 RepID=A0A165D7V6_9APHY|nr:Pkinase-domain-containing protein [Laetiporus sulphureus 93-53]KZT04293.1 Pkinase-domain-containing protein [Laetiporus sulphureus 93-53]